MTKKELIDAIVESIPRPDGTQVVDKLRVASVLETFCNVAAAEILGGGEITLHRIGTLKTRPARARSGRNPRTGESIEIPAGRRLVIAPTREFREALKS